MADPFATGLDEDPAADFLAREQQELAGLEDDGFGGLASGTVAYGIAQFFRCDYASLLEFVSVRLSRVISHRRLWPFLRGVIK